MDASEAAERRWSHGPALDGRANLRSNCRGQRGTFAVVGGVRNYPFRVGQHIVCIDGWLPPPPIQTAGRGGPPNPQKRPQPLKGSKRKDERMSKEKMFAMRMSQMDYDRIQHKAGQAGMSMTGFLTASALDKNIVVVDGLDKVLAELKAIGKNLNQLTTLCNMGRITCLDLTEIKSSFGTVFDYLYDRMDRG